MDIEVTIKFDTASEKYINQEKLELAVRLLVALGAKFPTDADEADKTKPA